MQPESLRHHRPTVLIFGSGRSGTTWVQDSLANANGYGTIFEPLCGEAVSRALPFANRYLPAGRYCPELRSFLDDVFGTATFDLWTSVRVQRGKLIPTPLTLTSIRETRTFLGSWRRAFNTWNVHRKSRGHPKIVKFIRANLLAEWLVREYLFASALIVRHPCAVLSSMMMTGSPEWDLRARRRILNRYLGQASLVRDMIKNFAKDVSKFDDLARIQTAVWCIENAVHLRGPAVVGLHVVSYEELILAGESAWARLADLLCLPKAPDKTALAQPSHQASVEYRSREGDNDAPSHIATWSERLTDIDVRRVQDVLDGFGVRAYSVQSPVPAWRVPN